MLVFILYLMQFVLSFFGFWISCILSLCCSCGKRELGKIWELQCKPFFKKTKNKKTYDLNDCSKHGLALFASLEKGAYDA